MTTYHQILNLINYEEHRFSLMPRMLKTSHAFSPSAPHACVYNDYYYYYLFICFLDKDCCSKRAKRDLADLQIH